MNFNQCISGAFHGAAVTRRAQYAANQRGLARAEVAGEPDHHAAGESGGQRGAQSQGIGFAG